MAIRYEKKLAAMYFKLRSKKYIASNGVEVKYILEKNTGNNAPFTVVFSAFPREGMKATYNYLKTLGNYKANKLFILDDYGHEHRGAYYLAEQGDFRIEVAIDELIEKMRRNLKPKKTVFIGTSKGGFAALYYGLKCDVDYIIAGAPQYKLGNYLSDVPLKKPILESIMGNHSQESITLLNSLLPAVIKKYNGNCRVFLHYSTQEHTYDEHIATLIDDLNANEISLEQDECQYKEHQEVSRYFPPYLLETVEKLK